jgi:hypothetical protein
MAKEPGSTLCHTLPSIQELLLQTFQDQCVWHVKKILHQSHYFVKTKPKSSVLAQFQDSSSEEFFFSTPVGLHKEGTRISIIALSGVNAATTNGPGPFDLRGLPFCKNPLPDWVIAQRRHCCGTRKQIIEAKQLGSSESGRCIVQRMYSESKMT